MLSFALQLYFSKYYATVNVILCSPLYVLALSTYARWRLGENQHPRILYRTLMALLLLAVVFAHQICHFIYVAIQPTIFLFLLDKCDSFMLILYTIPHVPFPYHRAPYVEMNIRMPHIVFTAQMLQQDMG